MLACILANLIEGGGSAVRALIERVALMPIRIERSGVWSIARMKCKLRGLRRFARTAVRRKLCGPWTGRNSRTNGSAAYR